MTGKINYENLYDNLISEDAFDFVNSGISARDKAFMCYYMMKKGEVCRAVAFIEHMAIQINNGQAGYSDMVFWLWTLGEYLKVTNDMRKKDIYSNTVYSCIEVIGQMWDRPAENWIGTLDEKGIYTANLSIAYGSILSVNNHLKNDKAQKLLIDIKKFIMERLLKKGMIVSKLGESHIYGDIGIIAAPFGLLGVEHRILVEAIEQMEKGMDLTVRDGCSKSNDILSGGLERVYVNCILSWYYSEKGNLAKAKWLLEQTEKIWDMKYCGKTHNKGNKDTVLSTVMYAIAKQNIVSVQQFKGFISKEVLSIAHKPTGTDDPYNFKDNERCPRHPEVGENVVLKMITEPFVSSQEAFVEYSVNGGQKTKISMSLETSPDDEKYWKADIGCFDHGDRVEYGFVVDDGQNTAVSTTYGFNVRQWHNIGRIKHFKRIKGEISLLFEPVMESSKTPCVKFIKTGDKAVKLSFSMEENINMAKNKAEYVFCNESTEILDMKLNEFGLNITLGEFVFGITNRNNKHLLQSYRSENFGFIDLLTDLNGTVHKIRYNFLMSSGEKFFGMGERYSHLQYRGKNVDNCVYNQYRDQGLRTYIPVPFSISSMKYGIYADTDMYSVFRFGTRLHDLFEIEVNLNEKNQVSDLYVFVGEPKEVIREFIKITGMPKLPPKWTFGLWMSSNNWDNQAEVYEQMRLANQYEIPATVLVLEQWSDEATFYIFNDAKYEVKPGDDYLEYEDYTYPEWGRWPDPKKMADDLHDQGLKLILWQVPVQKYMNGIAHAQRDEDERAMLENGYYIKLANGEPYRTPYGWFSDSLIPDFSNPQAVKWWFDKRLYLLKDIGVDGFKTDGGECIFGDGLVFSDGRTGDEMRNRYPNDYIGSYHEFMIQNGYEGITFSRAGYTGAQVFPLHWAGDDRSTYKALRSAVIAGLSCSMSGIPFWGWDFGGFHGDIPTAELYLRATQMAAFCPVMQYHAESKGEFNQDRTPWNIADRTGDMNVIEIFKKYTDLRMNMIPYIYQQAIISSRTGLPMMRAMFVEYPSDENCMEMTQQYMFGDSLLVAPVVTEGSSIKDIYLPEGKWMKLFTGEVVPGNRFIAEKADIGHIPVYIKQDSVIPFNLSDDLRLFSSVGNRLDRYKNLSFMIFLMGSLKYDFEDDLGNCVNISCSRAGNTIHIDTKSNYEGNFVLILRNCKGTDLTLNGGSIYEQGLENLKAGFYAVDGEDLIIKVAGK